MSTHVRTRTGCHRIPRVAAHSGKRSGQGPDRLASLNLIVTSRDRPDPCTRFSAPIYSSPANQVSQPTVTHSVTDLASTLDPDRTPTTPTSNCLSATTPFTPRCRDPTAMSAL
eukprot:3482789-Rhodomonas_salina.2